MNKYINSFNSIEEVTASISSYSPNVSYVEGASNPDGLVYTNVGIDKEIVFENNGGVISGKVKPIPLTFTGKDTENSVQLKWTNVGYSATNIELEVSINDGEWRPYEIVDGVGEIITLSKNNKISFRGNNETLGNRPPGPGGYWQFFMTGTIEAHGNIMSLLDKACERADVPAGAFCFMFMGCTSLTTTPELPATVLAAACYMNMFGGCTSLTTTPELPATTLAASCYRSMFYGCTSLTAAPELPATELANYCYGGMFDNCTSLIQAPELPAISLAQDCYNRMFYNCTSLTAAPELPATTLAQGCYNSMFWYCTSLTAAPELPATTLADGCYEYMFIDCTSLITAPELPAITLADHCYNCMFLRCRYLMELTVYANDISASDCVSDWLSDTAQGTTGGTLHSLGSADFTGKIPGNWTITNTPPQS